MMIERPPGRSATFAPASLISGVAFADTGKRITASVLAT